MFSSNTSQVSNDAVFVEDVFSTWLYTGNGSTQTITNGIDLAGKGGLVWLKVRDIASGQVWQDTARGTSSWLNSTNTNAAGTITTGITSFNANGFSLGSSGGWNGSTNLMASWTFRRAPKFFDVVTYTGTGSARTIAHNLGAVPGCIIVKKTSSSASWQIYHRSTGASQALEFNTDPSANAPAAWNATSPTSTVFSVGTDSNTNQSGETYVAYLFAHNAGGFGLTGTDNVISCGSTVGGSAVNLGYEPQWILMKNSGTAQDWQLVDNMRGMPVSGNDAMLNPNLSNAESSAAQVLLSATGFTINDSGTQNYIYIAIRRGPMKVPTSGTSVFSPNASSAANGTTLTTNFPVDLSITQERPAGDGAYWMDRLRGANSPGVTGTSPYLRSSVTNGETSTTITSGWDNTSIKIAYFGGISCIWWNFRRAPGFFDEVCYTGTGVATTQTHNLGVAPELVIVKSRGLALDWTVYSASLGASYWLYLNLTQAVVGPSANAWNSTTPTASVFTVGTSSLVNTSGSNYVAYLFASCPGVSKVGSYTGNGSSQLINCGFAGGARFVMIKRTDSTGDWYVWDTARGIVTANDPRLSLNSTAAEVTTDDSIDPNSSGFRVNQVAATNINVSSATYIYLAIA